MFNINRSVVLWNVALFAAAIAWLAVSEPSYLTQLVVWSAINAVLAAGMRFVLLIGETNMASGAIYGFAAYVTAIAVTNGFDVVPLVVVTAAIAAGVLGLLFGWVTLRVKGPYFMLIGFAFTEVVRLAYTRIDYVGGNSGMVGIYAPMSLDRWMPALCVGICYLLVSGFFVAEKSSFGLLMRAIRNNDKVVETLGVSALRVKLVCFCIAALAVGAAGAIHAYSYHVISPGDFSFLIPVYALAYAKVGGERHIVGSVIGAIFLTVVAQVVQGAGALQYVLFGGVIILTMLGVRGGMLDMLGWVACRRRRRAGAQHMGLPKDRTSGELG
ncbi:branched-chain amino acid ABC transporter permease [Paraburkholderia phytofirmans]|jgi:branched-chain amino acid transport system permease protein|uniref:Inner-membrane translocator n=1 Tax=Paraburkholderia phytofirmans (strain DSM 17436 / LMG 22146 / PsJN) TaxID=398527 RepID=B2T8U7_PARPJ|nr:branched-chain amino acid ABC transporter permease [Paraburkholderia phytofirmans]ACD20760.1 inner-membrane translocator [Paraburkholderia phytofirmans PsJN]